VYLPIIRGTSFHFAPLCYPFTPLGISILLLIEKINLFYGYFSFFLKNIPSFATFRTSVLFESNGILFPYSFQYGRPSFTAQKGFRQRPFHPRLNETPKISGPILSRAKGAQPCAKALLEPDADALRGCSSPEFFQIFFRHSFQSAGRQRPEGNFGIQPPQKLRSEILSQSILQLRVPSPGTEAKALTLQLAAYIAGHDHDGIAKADFSSR
jgi:hypothetical protein